MPDSQETPVPEAIVTALAEAGVEYVVGMPGGYTGPLFVALHSHPRIRVVQVREESIGTVMADAYGRLRGKPMVVMGQGEWIAGNAGQGLLESLLGSAPVVVLTEMSDGGRFSHHAPYQAGTGDYGNWDARMVLQGMTKRVMVAHSGVQAVQLTQLAFKHAMTGQPGPVAVIYTGRALSATVRANSIPAIYRSDAYLPRGKRTIDLGAVERAAKRFSDAERPVIIAGNGVRVGQACDELVAVATALEVPVVTTSSGKGVFPESHPLAGGVMGSFGNGAANYLVATADLLLAIGTKLAPMDTADENAKLIDPARQTIVQVDTEPLNISWTYPADEQVVADAGYFLQTFRQFANDGEVPAKRGIAEVAAARGHASVSNGRPAESDLELTPHDIVQVLGECVPDSAVVTCDAGENRLFMLQWYRTKLPGGYLQPASGGGMGYAVPAALGAKLANFDRPVIAVCGDGGFAMSLHALMTAVQERIPIAVIVFNNNALGWVLHGMGDKVVAANFAAFDYGAIATAIGCDGARVRNTSELRTALGGIAALTKPLVVEVATSLATSFKDIVQPIASSRWTAGD